MQSAQRLSLETKKHDWLRINRTDSTDSYKLKEHGYGQIVRIKVINVGGPEQLKPTRLHSNFVFRCSILVFFLTWHWFWWYKIQVLSDIGPCSGSQNWNWLASVVWGWCQSDHYCDKTEIGLGGLGMVPIRSLLSQFRLGILGRTLKVVLPSACSVFSWRSLPIISMPSRKWHTVIGKNNYADFTELQNCLNLELRRWLQIPFYPFSYRSLLPSLSSPWYWLLFLPFAFAPSPSQYAFSVIWPATSVIAGL